MKKIYIALLSLSFSLFLYAPDSYSMIKAGGSLGASHLIDDDFDNTGIALDGNVGIDILPKMSILGLAAVHIGREDFDAGGDTTLLNFFAGPVLEVFLNDRFFVRGGGGYVYTWANYSVDIAGSTLNFDYDRSGFGLYSGVGVVLLNLGLTNVNLNVNYIPQWFDGGQRDSFVHWIYGGVGFGF